MMAEKPTQPEPPKPPKKKLSLWGKIKKALGEVEDAAGEAAGEAFVNR